MAAEVFPLHLCAKRDRAPISLLTGTNITRARGGILLKQNAMHKTARTSLPCLRQNQLYRSRCNSIRMIDQSH